MAQTRVPYFRSIAQVSNAQMLAYPKQGVEYQVTIQVSVDGDLNNM